MSASQALTTALSLKTFLRPAFRRPYLCMLQLQRCLPRSEPRHLRRLTKHQLVNQPICLERLRRRHPRDRRQTQAQTTTTRTTTSRSKSRPAFLLILFKKVIPAYTLRLRLPHLRDQSQCEMSQTLAQPLRPLFRNRQLSLPQRQLLRPSPGVVSTSPDALWTGDRPTWAEDLARMQ